MDTLGSFFSQLKESPEILIQRADPELHKNLKTQVLSNLQYIYSLIYNSITKQGTKKNESCLSAGQLHVQNMTPQQIWTQIDELLTENIPHFEKQIKNSEKLLRLPLEKKQKTSSEPRQNSRQAQNFSENTNNTNSKEGGSTTHQEDENSDDSESCFFEDIEKYRNKKRSAIQEDLLKQGDMERFLEKYEKKDMDGSEDEEEDDDEVIIGKQECDADEKNLKYLLEQYKKTIDLDSKKINSQQKKQQESQNVGNQKIQFSASTASTHDEISNDNDSDQEHEDFYDSDNSFENNENSSQTIIHQNNVEETETESEDELINKQQMTNDSFDQLQQKTISAQDVQNDSKKNIFTYQNIQQLNSIMFDPTAIEEIEKELVAEKHWSLKGEVNASQRSKNSLLAMNLALPSYKRTMCEAFPDTLAIDDTPELPNKAITSNSALTDQIETLVKRRIRNVIFDDVLRRPEPTIEKTVEDAPDVDCQKSQKGLAEIYEEEYKRQVLGQQTEDNQETHQKKVEILELFAAILYKLDSLSHQRTITKPLKSLSTKAKDISTVMIEDTVPILMSSAQHKAPEEYHKVKHEKTNKIMSREERKAVRQLKKERRRKSQKNQLIEGKTDLRQELKKRIENQNKNKKRNEEKAKKEKSGDQVYKGGRTKNIFFNALSELTG